MADGERKSLVWSIKKDLLNLPADELFQIARSVSAVAEVEPLRPESADEEDCYEYITSFMSSKTLLESEDTGMAHLLELRDLVDAAIQGHASQLQMQRPDARITQVPFVNPQGHDADLKDSQAKGSVDPVVTFQNDLPTVSDVNADKQGILVASDVGSTDIQKLLASCEELSKQVRQYIPTTHSQSALHPPEKSQIKLQNTESRDKLNTPLVQDGLISLRDLSYLHRREFKIQGGQIGDQGSDINYNNICRQIDEGLRDQFSDTEIVRAVLRVIKPGNFKEMLMNKDDLTVEELKGFLHSHLGEQSNTEFFQELMCTKQRDNETPQQFLYRVIGLKQKIILASKHAETDVKYSPSTVQDIFIHTVYQGLGHKHDDVRRELKPLLADPGVTDEAILRQMRKIMSDENERQKRLGSAPRQRPTNLHSVQAEANAAQYPSAKEGLGRTPQADGVQQLKEKVEKLTTLVESLQKLTQQQASEPNNQPPRHNRVKQTGRRYGCMKCLEQNRPDCTHCFHCGEEGHKAVGCLQRPTRQGNWSRSLPGDRQ
ncbi:uncharacterized protein LOC106953786 [Poecilia latipinna]|uniref:uncharacterized protein LOC106953786 n=1 Tax=Poecilia latipinna TaxID=48699 RepID=UPI00072E2A3E|nr:PREDICTED: uncharacterized protein LOC106953786 [Poecilia latipinna]